MSVTASGTATASNTSCRSPYEAACSLLYGCLPPWRRGVTFIPSTEHDVPTVGLGAATASSQTAVCLSSTEFITGVPGHARPGRARCTVQAGSVTGDPDLLPEPASSGPVITIIVSPFPDNGRRDAARFGCPGRALLPRLAGQIGRGAVSCRREQGTLSGSRATSVVAGTIISLIF